MNETQKYALGGLLVGVLATWYILKKRQEASMGALLQAAEDKGWDAGHQNVINFLKTADTQRYSALQCAQMLEQYATDNAKA